MSINKSVTKSAGLIALATLVSRLLGFFRDIVIARLFGIYAYAQAFVIAFKIPNLFRDFFGEGAANAAIVPVFTEYSVKQKKEEFWELANVVLNLLLIGLAAITLLSIIFAPLIVRLIAPGFVGFAEKFSVTVKLTRLIFPYVLLICLAAYATGLLNSLKHFAVSAFAPCLLNISIIAFAVILGENTNGLALGVLIGGLLQLAVQVPVLYKKGFRLRLFKGFKHPAVKTIARLMLPRVLSTSIYQLNNFVDSIFGSLSLIVGEGGVAVLYFSYRLIQFPLGIFSNALSQAILPRFCAQALEGTRQNLKHTLSFGVRSVFFVMLPASIGFMALSEPIVSTLFGGGKFDLNSSRLTSQALFFYSIGLCAYGSTKILQSCFFALKDTVTPAKISAVALAVNIVLNAAFMFPLKISGIALATSLSGINSFIILFVILDKRLGGLDRKEIFGSALRTLTASAAMGLVCRFLYAHLSFNKYLNLGATLIAGVISYFAFCFILRVKEIQQLRQWIWKRT